MRSTFFFTCCVAFILLLPVQGVAIEDSRVLSDAVTQIAAGDYDAALLSLYPLAQARKDDAVYQYWLGRAYYGQRFYLLAAASLGEAANRDAQNRDVCLWHARALRACGKFGELAEVFPLYVARFPRDPHIISEYALFCAIIGRLDDGRTALVRLTEENASPEIREFVASWEEALKNYTPRTAVEPPARRPAPNFTLCYDTSTAMSRELIDAVEAIRAETATAFAVPMTGFTVAAFSTWQGFARYAMSISGDNSVPTSIAVCYDTTLAFYVPNKWPKDARDRQELDSVLRHEMAHLAINLRTRGQGVPLWLHEGLACYFGGTGGVRTGQLPATPLPPRALNQIFLFGAPERREVAYAQSHAMATVLHKRLGQAKLLQLLDRATTGMPFALAYQQISGDPYDTFLAEWPKRYAQGK